MVNFNDSYDVFEVPLDHGEGHLYFYCFFKGMSFIFKSVFLILVLPQNAKNILHTLPQFYFHFQ